MNLNPEFQRQLQLECSQSNIIGIPVMLGILFALSYFLDGQRLGGITTKVALTLFLFIALLWGARKAMNSIIEEYRDHTWDTQRLSALGPWQMTWGKLLGSTVTVWYGGFICLLVHAMASGDYVDLSYFWFYGISSGLLLQTGSLLLGLLAVHRGQIKNDALFIISILVFFLLIPWLKDIPDTSFFRQAALSDWYGIALDKTSLYRINLFAALFWCTVASYRMMAQALGLRTLPWVWLSFLVFLVVYIGGFLSSSPYSFSLIMLLACAALTYAGLLSERNDAIRIKYFVSYLAQHNWRRAGEEIPIWWLSFLMTIPAAFLLVFSNNPIQGFSTVLHFYPIAIVLILLRDCLIYLYFLYGNKPQRAFSTTLLAGFFLYGILPGIFGFFGIRGLSTLAFPLLADTALNALIWSFFQTAIMLKLVYHRWQSRI